jgi:hypothetical protein
MAVVVAGFLFEARKLFAARVFRAADLAIGFALERFAGCLAMDFLEWESSSEFLYIN